ncbi:putative permease [Vibrio alginolyticus 40B]|nr:putative permease [Vibrio alginolyticus 40B]
MFNSERKATVILVATTMIAALGWIFSKETIQGLPPFGFIGARFTIASLCLLPLCYRPLLKANLKDVLSAGGVGLLLGSAVMTWIYAISISDTLGEGAFIMSLSMLFVPIVAWVMFRQRPQRIFWLSLPIAVLGLACLSLVGGWKQSASQLWFLGAALVLALHFNVNSKYSQKLPVLLLTCVQLFSARLFRFVGFIFYGIFPGRGGLLYLVVVCVEYLISDELALRNANHGAKICSGR